MMTLHNCELCSYSTKHKSSFQKHLQSKKHILRCQLHESNKTQNMTQESNLEVERQKSEDDCTQTKEISMLKNLLEESIKRIESLEAQNAKFKKFILSLKDNVDDIENQQHEQYDFNIKMLKLMKKNQRQFEQLSGFEPSNDDDDREIII